MGKSLLGRIDKNKKGFLGATKGNATPSTLQIYKDVNHALGILFRIAFGWVGIDVDKYLRRKPKKHKKSNRSMLGRIGF